MSVIRNVLIALPTTHQSMKSATALSVANAAVALRDEGIGVDLHNIDSAEIVTARDMFANMVLHSDTWTHLLFVDSDMHFAPSLAVRLFQQQADVTAVAYTRRHMDLATFVEVTNMSGNQQMAAAHASEFTFKPFWDSAPAELKVSDGFCLGAAVGMGLALITKSALEQMIESQVVHPRLDLSAGPDKTCWSFFETFEVDGIRLGEDYSFCHRWTAQMGRELPVCIDEAIGHLGGYEYRARFLDRLTPAQPA